MKILTISGSSRPESSNVALLNSLGALMPEHRFELASIIYSFPIFQAHLDRNPPQEVIEFKNMIDNSDAVIICTPEYIHNMPASIKNAMEWITSSGEFVNKPILAITYTPSEPRGEKAMQSLLWSLGALDAKIITEMRLYSSDFSKNEGRIIGGDGIEMIREAIGLLLQ